MTHAQPFFAPTMFRPSAAAPLSTSAELGLMLLGPSAAMTQLWGQIRRLAPHVRSVLLTGEPDCGQEAVARLLLDFSAQSHRSFVQLTAAEADARLGRPSGLSSLPADLFLFLPDVDRFSELAQEALLRLMRMRRSRPFTVVASTSEDLRVLVGMGRFSGALADALGSLRIALPALRHRLEDIPMLASHMLASYSQKTGAQAPQAGQEFLQAAMQHAWTGNLCELAQVMMHLAQHGSGQELRAADLQSALASQRVTSSPSLVAPRLVSLDTVIQEHIGAVLQACRGNKLRASEVLGISRSTLYRMLDAASVSQGASLPIAS